MQIKIRAWDKVNNRMQSWEELLAGKEFKAKLQDPEAHGMVLMMWTGLKDKNGKEIYEGDRVAINGLDYRVFWSSKSVEFCIDSVDFEGRNLSKVFKNAVVLGNIYENPELMVGGRNEDSGSF